MRTLVRDPVCPKRSCLRLAALPATAPPRDRLHLIAAASLLDEWHTLTLTTSFHNHVIRLPLEIH